MPESIVLITIDCLRFDHVSAYGYDRPTTPNIDRLAERGTRFTRAFSNGPGTRFAFKALNAGTYPLRIRGSGLPARSGVTLAEHLSEQGYRTAGFVDNPFLTRYFNHHRGFSTFFDAKSWDEEMDASTDLLSQLNRFTSTVSEALPED